MRLEHVLIATDLTEHSLDLAASALALVRARGARATLLHVVPTPVTLGNLADGEAAAAEASADARATLARLEGIGDDVEIVVGAAPAAIAERGSHADIDLVIVGARPRENPWRLLLGSTSIQVAHQIGKPVLVLRAPLAEPAFRAPLLASPPSASTDGAADCVAALAPGAPVEHLVVDDEPSRWVSDQILEAASGRDLIAVGSWSQTGPDGVAAVVDRVLAAADVAVVVA